MPAHRDNRGDNPKRRIRSSRRALGGLFSDFRFITLTPMQRPCILTVVELLFRRTAALLVVLTLGAAGWAECAGWQATPEARMACCSGSGDCPMHGSTEPGAGSERVVTQAQADSCCAASDTNDSTPSTAVYSLSPSAVLVSSTLQTLAPIMAPPSFFDAWRTHVPLPRGHVPRYVLLSVFLI